MTITSSPTLDHPTLWTRKWLRIAGWAGIAGPVLFTVVFLAQDVLRAGYDPIAEPVSALEAGRHGWIQQLNFVVFGILTLVFASGLHRGIERTRAGLAGPALLAVSGIGLLLAAAFPLREDAAGVVYDPGGHFIGGVLFFPVTALALIVLWHRLGRDPRWRNLAGYTLAAGVVGAAVVVLVTITLVLPEAGPLHPLGGLVQRITILAIFFPARLLLSARLLRVAVAA
jgi:hypothetical membrane protein